MDPAHALARLGGVAPADRLLALTSRKRLRAALERGEVARVARGRYRLPGASEAMVKAERLSGALAMRSAALEHGWPVKWTPDVPDVAVDRNRHQPSARGVNLLWMADLESGRRVTRPLDTVLMSARRLPFDEALAIADSALRSRMLTRSEVVAAADHARGAGAARVRRVAEHADGRAANPFESVLRAITLDLGLTFVPQLPVDVGERVLRPDLVDPVHRVVLEADSWTWHTGHQAHVNDCWRYNALVACGWSLLRFAWEHVMLQPAYVVKVLTTVSAGWTRGRGTRCTSRAGAPARSA